MSGTDKGANHVRDKQSGHALRLYASTQPLLIATAENIPLTIIAILDT
jgi:hypothetical protein